MEKLQILFLEPQLNKLREIAKREDRPVDELVRNAVRFWIHCYSTDTMNNIEETPVTAAYYYQSCIVFSLLIYNITLEIYLRKVKNVLSKRA